MSSTDSIRELIESVDLIELVTRYAGSGRSNGAQTTFSCPHPSHPDEHPSFVVARNRNGRQVWRCFSMCDRRGDALDLIEWLDGLSRAEALQRLREIAGRPAPTRSDTHRPSPPRPAPAPRRAPDRSQTLDADWLLDKYAQSRGWSSEIVQRFDLTVVTDHHGQMRIRHPFYAPDDTGSWSPAYWQDRARSGVSPKWLSPRGISPVLFNLRSLHPDVSTVVICEGPPDTITAATALADVPEVACIGVPGVSAWRDEWGALVSDLRIVVAADPDDAGRKLEAAVLASVRRPVTMVRFTDGDLTDTARREGLAAMRDRLLDACALTTPATVEDLIERLYELFPGGQLIGAGSETSRDEN